MNRFVSLLVASGGLIVFPLMDSAIKGTIVLLVATASCLALRRDSAATRHFVWVVAICLLIAMPMLSLVLPEWQVLPSWLSADEPEIAAAYPSSFEPSAPLLAPVEIPELTPAMPLPGLFMPGPHASGEETTKEPGFEAVETTRVSATDTEAASPSSVPWTAWLSGVWFAGCALLASRLLAAAVLLRRSARRCELVADATASGMRQLPGTTSSQNADAESQRLQNSLIQAMALLGVKRPIQLLLDPHRSIPIVWGLINTRLQLPAEAVNWKDEQLQSVLLHELAHVRRRDLFVLTLTQIACALHWFNPLVWVAAWRLHVERERACDDLVLASGVRASAYAEHLLNIATQLRSPQWTQACGLAMARNSSLHGRLTAVLSEKQNRRSVTTALLILSVVVSSAVAIPVAMLRAADEKASGEPVANQSAGNESVVKEPLKPGAYHGMDVSLIRRWKQLDEPTDSISESRVATLRSAIGRFIEGIDQSPFSLTQEQISALKMLQTQGADETRHTAAETEGFVKAVFAIHGEPIQMAFNEAPWPGTPGNTDELERLPFGPAAADGLRVALVCEKDDFIFGDSARLDLRLWNTGSETLVVGIGRNSPGLYPRLELQAIGRGGRRVETKFGPESKMLAETQFTKTWQLRPGETAEVFGYRLRVGSGTPRELEGWPEWYTVIDLPDAQSGEEIQLTGVLPSLDAHGTPSSTAGMQTGTIKMRAIAPEHVQVWSAVGAGRWPMPQGVSLELKQECFHAADIATSVVLTWPEDASGTTYAYTSDVASDAFANREPWHVAWEKDSTTFWSMTGNLGRREPGLATPSHVRRIDFADKMNIVTTTWYHQPEAMPESIRLEFEKVFKPLPATPRLATQAEGFVQVNQAHDVRPIDELLHGVWKNEEGDVDVQLIFPERDTDSIQWTVDYGKRIPAVPATMARINSPGDNSIRLWIRPSQISSPDEKDIVGTVRRGPDSSLLLDITGSPKYPEYKKITGIVLTQVSPSKSNTAQTVNPSQETNPPANGDDSENEFPKSYSVDWQDMPKLPVYALCTDAWIDFHEQHLDWSEPVNGLRAAVRIRWTSATGIDGKERKIFLVVQNVSDQPIRFCDTAIEETDVPAADTEGRTLYLQDTEGILMGMQRAVSTKTDQVLQPRHMLSIDMFDNEEPKEQGYKTGDMIAHGIVKIPSRSLFAVLKIVNAPEGAWTGKLATPSTRGAFAAQGPMPKSKEGQTLFRYCLDHARTNGKIPGGLMNRLHDMVQEFIGNNSGDTFGDPYAKKMEPLLARFTQKEDWKQADVVSLFDDIAAVTTIPLERTMDTIRERTLQRGQQLPASLNNANWGEALPGGLRMAWILEPQAGAYHLGSSLKSRVVIHNSGKEPVAFVTRSFHQPTHKAKTAVGATVQIESTSWLTRGQPEPYRLHPGEYCEVNAPGIGIGPNNPNNDDWANVRPGSWILAEEGEDVVFQPGEIMLTGDHNHKVNPDWWLTFIKERINRDAPLLADQKEREVILFRVVSDLFGNSPTPEEAAAFYPDLTPEAVENLATLLSKRSWLTSVAGPIKGGATKFRVLAEDPEAATRPRVAMNPGRYSLGDDMRLVVTRRPVGHRIVNEADLIWYPKGKDPVPLKISLPDGLNTWAAAWSPGTTVLWIHQKAGMRRYDFDDPAAMKETRFGPNEAAGEPKEIHDAIMKALDIPDAPVQQAKPPTEHPALMP